MASKTKKWSGSAASKSQVQAFTPTVTATASVWALTINGKTLTYPSNGTVADAVNGMAALWQASNEPEFQEISASVPSSLNAPAAPQGAGTNEIQAIYISGAPTGGSFQLAWNGGVTAFLPDPTGAPSASDSGNAGNVNGTVKYTYTFLNVNPLGIISETLPSPEASVTVANHSVRKLIYTGPNNPAANQICIGRRIYRTAAGGASGTEKLAETIWDNTTTAYTDNLADGSLGAAQPTANATGISYTATAAQLQGILQELSSILPGNLVVSGSGTAAAPWLVQFTGELGALKQALVTSGEQAFTFAATVPAQTTPKVVITEIQQGVQPNATVPADGLSLLLVSKAGVPFYVTSAVSGVVPPTLTVSPILQTIPPSPGQLKITEAPATVTVQRTVAARAGSNELQEITISPDAESGSTFNLSFGGDTTAEIPIPPIAPSAVSGAAGNPNGVYYWVQTFLTATGETEPSAPSAAVTLTNQQATVTIVNGASVVTGKRIYRTLAGGAITGPYYLAGTVSNNTTTTFTDNVSDATIATQPQPPTTNGVLLGELEALAAIGQGNVQVSGANAAAFSGMAIETGFPATPPVIATAAIGGKPVISSTNGLTSSATGGALASGTYYYQVTAVDAFGETLPSAEKSIAVQGPTGRVIVTWLTVTGANGYRIYRGISAQNENTLIGVVNSSTLSFIDYGTAPSPIVYRVEFINALAKASQDLITGSAAHINILPRVTIAETQAGYPVGNEVQVVGWVQKFGAAAPDGKSTFKLTFPDLNVTTAAIQVNQESAGVVLSAIQAAVPLANFNDFAVSEVANTSGAYLVAITYQGNLAGRELALCAVDTSGMIPATGDSVVPYSRRAQTGSPVGRNEIITVTLNDGPGGGTFGLTATLADGNVLTATGLAYNASAATVKAALPSATMQVSGNAGGPYTIEAVGEAGNQKVVWSATSSLTSGGGVSGSPPASNTSKLSAPTGVQAVTSTGGYYNLAPGTYYYKVTATDANGETTPSSEVSTSIADNQHVATISWNAVAGATGYKVYRGTSSGGENTLVASGVTDTKFSDSGNSNTAASPPVSNTAGISAPTIVIGSPGTFGNLSSATYYYKATATNSSGETTGSNEVSAAVTGPNATLNISWNAIPGATGYKVYRGTSAGSENLLIATLSATGLGFNDDGSLSTAATPPASNTTGLTAPVQSNPSTLSSGGSLASATYYYEVTATNSAGETTASNEKNIAVTGPTGEVTVSWGAVTGASGYKVYRGTGAGEENLLVGIVTSGATVSFTDTGAPPAPVTLSVSEIFAGLSPLNDTQTVTLNNAGGGSFGLLLGNQSATNLPFNISAANLQTSLQLLANVGENNCTVTETASAGTSVYTIEFNGALAAQPQPLMSALGITSQPPPTVNTAVYAVDTGIPTGFGSDIFLFFPMSPPTNVVAQAVAGGALVSGTYYYKITAIGETDTGGSIGETLPSTEVSAGVAGVPPGGGAPIGPASVELTWSPPTPPSGVPAGALPTGYQIYRGPSQGNENQLVATIYGDTRTFTDDGTAIQHSTLQGGGQYVVSLSPGATDNFTLSFGGDTTPAIAYNASQSTIQSDLQALTSIGGGGAVVTGPDGGPWNIYLTATVAATGTLSGTMASIVEFASYTSVFAINVHLAVAGSFALKYGPGGGGDNVTAGIPYNATAAQVQTAVAALPIIASSGGAITVTASGPTGGPWGLTISATAQTANYLVSGDGRSLIGAAGTFPSYPVTYALATGPNFWDAPGNWADGSIPSLYLAPPTIAAVVPTSTDATLLPVDSDGNATHGSLTSGTTYYYKVTATNANGETAGSGEASAEAFAGAYFYFTGTPTSGTYNLTYGGYTASIPYTDNAAAIQAALNGLTSIATNGGSCTVTGSGTLASPFIFQLAGTLTGTAPKPLTADSSSLVGAVVSVRNFDTRSLAVSWSEVYGATGYKVYRGTAAGSENVLVATITNPDQTVFVDDGTYTTTAASPPVDANSYHTAVGDDVYFTGSSVSCLYNIAADVTCGYSVHGGFNGSNYSQVNSLTIDASFTGFIGPPVVNPAGYSEYRPTLLKIQGPPAGVFPITIGNGSGGGSANLGLDTGTSEIALSIVTLATPTGTLPVAMVWVGANAASEIDLSFGSLGIAPYPGQTAQLGTLRQAYQQNQNSDTTLIVGAGCATIPTFIKSGGVTTLFANVATLTGKGGTINQQAGAVTGTLSLVGCTYVSQSTAVMGTVNVAGAAVFDRSQDSRALSVGALNLYAGASYLDPHGCTVTTGDAFLDYELVQCGYEDVTLQLGKNLSAQRTQN